MERTFERVDERALRLLTTIVRRYRYTTWLAQFSRSYSPLLSS